MVYYKKSMFLHKKCSDFHLLEIHNSKSIQDKQKKIAGKKKKSRFSPFLLFQFTITLVTTTKIFYLIAHYHRLRNPTIMVTLL